MKMSVAVIAAFVVAAGMSYGLERKGKGPAIVGQVTDRGYIMRYANDGPVEPWGSKGQPGDQPKCHVEEIVKAKQEFTVTQGGTMDGENCRGPMGTWQNLEQTWESNRSVRMENVGETDVIDPWLSNGRNNFRTVQEIVDGVITPGMSEGEKARALWWFETTHRFHFPVGSNEAKHPVTVMNTLGYNTCGDDAECLSGLWKTAGLKVRPERLVGHCVSQVYYDGGWHTMDSDQQAIYMLRDNRTVASEKELVRDHDLIKRTHTAGIMQKDDRAMEEWDASLYVYEGDKAATRDMVGTHTMGMTLRPGEALTWRWGHKIPAKYNGTQDVTQKAGWCYPCTDQICNGLWEYRPDFGKETWSKGAERVTNIETMREGLGLVARGKKAGEVVWRMRSPYLFVGGHIETDGTWTKWSISWDGKKWEEIKEAIGNFYYFDSKFPAAGPARYEYYVKCELNEVMMLKTVKIMNDVQMAPVGMPGMKIGENKLVYTDSTQGERKVRITQEWVERSSSRSPEAPATTVYPKDGGETDGTDITFKWEEAKDQGGDKIADYQFQLSDREDMRWALSGSFWKLISLTADKGKAQYTLLYAGLVTPDARYYWRVRAKNDKGVWGEWSKTWSFTARGCAPPVDVRVVWDAKKGAGALKWKAGAEGRRPAKYRVYGSDEKGFTAMDKEYAVNVGASKEVKSPFPANYVGETTETEMEVVGDAVTNGNKAYYRVVAVDKEGKRSGASDYASAPRPVIYTKALEKGKAGAAYRYEAKAIRSIGNLQMRSDGTNFWDVEKPTFALAKGPKWLKMDAKTGVLSGTPKAAGKFEVEVRATIVREVSVPDEEALIHGRYVAKATKREKVGSTAQKFTLVIR